MSYPSYPSYPSYMHFNMNGYTSDYQNNCPPSWKAPTQNTFYQTECYQQPHCTNESVSPLSYPTYQEPIPSEFYPSHWEGNHFEQQWGNGYTSSPNVYQLHHDFPFGESCIHPQWEGDYYQKQWDDMYYNSYEENNEVEDNGTSQLMVELTNKMHEMSNSMEKFVEILSQQALTSQPIDVDHNPSTLQPEFTKTNNGMEIEDNYRDPLFYELTNKMNHINNSLDKLVTLQELQDHAIEPTIVEPSSPTYNSPHIASFTYWAKMHNDMAQSTPIDDGHSEESYKDEIDNVNAIGSLRVENMNWQKDESPVDSNSIVDGDLGNELTEESTSNVDSYTIQKPLPLSIKEVVPYVHLPSSPTSYHESYREFELSKLPILHDFVMYEEDEDDTFLKSSIFDEEESLEENTVHTFEEPKQIFNQIRPTLEDLKLQQQAHTFLDLVTYVDDNDLFAQIDRFLQAPSKQVEQNFDFHDNLHIDSILPKGEVCESFSTNPLLLSPFIEPWPPPIVEVEDVIGNVNITQLDLCILPKQCGITLISILNKFGGLVLCAISSELEPDISWGEMQFYEDIPIIFFAKLFYWDDPQKFRLLFYDDYFD